MALAGIYIHIPFCRQACRYCDFHFSTNLKFKSEMIDALCRELILRKDYLPEPAVKTVYFGGGTPSLLEKEDFKKLFETINENFSVAPDAEITLEANPDDLSESYINMLFGVGFNRLSIGVQSFDNERLKYLNRVHNAEEAKQCLLLAKSAGFTNISIDLMYGIPSESLESWESDLDKALSLQVQHISAYCLTIEEKTVFGHWQKQGKLTPLDEETAARQFELLIDKLMVAGFEHYEISNFAQPGFRSRHNTNYWNGTPYIGIGPSAHSFDGRDRQFTVRNNASYMKAIGEGKVPYTKEELSVPERINDIILTTIRTSEGCDLKKIKTEFKSEPDPEAVKELIDGKLITSDNDVLILTEKGKLLADYVTEKLIITE